MARTPNAVFGLAWIPDLEKPAKAYPQRMRSMLHVIDYRHALACSRGEIDGDRATRVLYREMKSPTAELNSKGEPIVRAFDVRANPGGMALIREIKPACECCGCTEDRACDPPCAWASRNPPRCTACE